MLERNITGQILYDIKTGKNFLPEDPETLTPCDYCFIDPNVDKNLCRELHRGYNNDECRPAVSERENANRKYGEYLFTTTIKKAVAEAFRRGMSYKEISHKLEDADFDFAEPLSKTKDKTSRVMPVERIEGFKDPNYIFK